MVHEEVSETYNKVVTHHKQVLIDRENMLKEKER